MRDTGQDVKPTSPIEIAEIWRLREAGLESSRPKSDLQTNSVVVKFEIGAGAYFLWPLCLPQACLVLDYGQKPNRRSRTTLFLREREIVCSWLP